MTYRALTLFWYTLRKHWPTLKTLLFTLKNKLILQFLMCVYVCVHVCACILIFKCQACEDSFCWRNLWKSKKGDNFIYTETFSSLKNGTRQSSGDKWDLSPVMWGLWDMSAIFGSIALKTDKRVCDNTEMKRLEGPKSPADKFYFCPRLSNQSSNSTHVTRVTHMTNARFPSWSWCHVKPNKHTLKNVGQPFW